MQVATQRSKIITLLVYQLNHIPWSPMQRSILSLLLSEAECYFILNIYLSLLISPVIFLNIQANFHISRLQSIFGGSTSGVGNKAINISKTTEEHYLQTDMNWNQPQMINKRVL
jgi:hypothetical protein